VTRAADGEASAPIAAKATPVRPADALTIEHIVGTEAPREFRLDPRGRVAAFTQEAAGARQLFTLPLRGGPATQVTASEKNVSDPRWSPDGRRLAFVRDGAIAVVDADGSRLVTLGHHPAGESMPRWSPDGRRIAFISRRRGWAQVWVVDAPVPRRGRPAATPKPDTPVVITPAGLDVDEYAWSPDGTRLAIAAERGEAIRHASRISVVTVADGSERPIGEGADWECGVRWLPDGGLIFISDADGWFQVLRVAADLSTRTPVTAGALEHGEPGGLYGLEALPSPDGRLVAHPTIHDGLVDIVVDPLEGAAARARGRSRTGSVAGPVPAAIGAIQPWLGVWRSVGWLPDGGWLAAIGESETRPQDLWLLPVPGVAPEGARPRQLTSSLPAVLGPAVARFPAGERVAITARDGLRVEGTLWRPTTATGRRGAAKVPAVVYPHGGPTSQAYRTWQPFKHLLVHEGFAVLDIDFRGSTGYGRAFREANTDEWGHADLFDVVDAGRWLQAQPWCDGRLGVWGGSYGGYLVLGALVEAPDLWRAGVDLFGDSEIAESYKHGDRVGRIDLERQMGKPDDPERALRYRRGSPLYRAERIQAPLLILHGRKDKRVVPLMSEKMIEALEIEGKFHEVRWYDEEAHGWQARENRRDAFTRIRDFLKTHVLESPVDG
jgi:dipeptidyl aminopeptidase/acylaminoacyl peptidase